MMQYVDIVIFRYFSTLLDNAPTSLQTTPTSEISKKKHQDIHCETTRSGSTAVPSKLLSNVQPQSHSLWPGMSKKKKLHDRWWMDLGHFQLGFSMIISNVASIVVSSKKNLITWMILVILLSDVHWKSKNPRSLFFSEHVATPLGCKKSFQDHTCPVFLLQSSQDSGAFHMCICCAWDFR